MQSTVPQKVTQGTSDFALARKVLDYMIKHHVPPTPENYTIWHMHLSGKNSELSHEMQRLMMQFPHFSTDVNNYLVSKYMPSSGGKKVQETVQVAQDILNDVMMIIGQFNGEAASQSQKMASKA